MHVRNWKLFIMSIAIPCIVKDSVEDRAFSIRKSVIIIAFAFETCDFGLSEHQRTGGFIWSRTVKFLDQSCGLVSATSLTPQAHVFLSLAAIEYEGTMVGERGKNNNNNTQTL